MAIDKVALFLFCIAVAGIGALIGINFPTGSWYEGLNKPWFNPPGWIFGPVWTFLYVLIGIAGWRNWFRSHDGALKGLWLVQMVLNFAWSPIFFGAQRPGAALVVILLLLFTIITYMIVAHRRDRISMALFAPYFLWVAFASCLNGAIWRLN